MNISVIPILRPWKFAESGQEWACMHVAAVLPFTLHNQTATRHCIWIGSQVVYLYTCYTACIPFNIHTTVSTAQSIGMCKR